METLKRFSEFQFTPKLISEIIEYTNTQTLPAHVDTPEREESWHHNFDGFEHRDGVLFFKDHEVVPYTAAAIRDVLTTVYKSPEALGKGINALHMYIQSKYIGIRRSQVQAFLKKQIPY